MTSPAGVPASMSMTSVGGRVGIASRRGGLDATFGSTAAASDPGPAPAPASASAPAAAASTPSKRASDAAHAV